MASGNYNLNEGSARDKELLLIIKLLASNDQRGDSQQVSIRQKADGGEWELTTQGQQFTDKSLSRVIERAGRALTTVYDR